MCFFLVCECFFLRGWCVSSVDRTPTHTTHLCTYSGEASIFRNSPSSRSESAMLSAELLSECSTFFRIFCDRILIVIIQNSFRYLTRICPKISVQLNSLRHEIVRLDQLGLIICGRCRFGVFATPPWVSHGFIIQSEMGRGRKGQ